jgi:hypothetical protein
VFTARYALSPYVKQIGFVFKGLIILLEIDEFITICMICVPINEEKNV